MNRTFARLMTLTLTLMLGMAAGCSQSSTDQAGHDDHEDRDHFVPVHWPSDITDIATKIDVRKVALNADGVSSEKRRKVLKKELIDIVGWAPEIAADSYLKESEWVPVYEESLRLSQRLNSMGLVLNDEMAGELQRFSELIRKSAALEANNRPNKLSDEATGKGDEATGKGDGDTRS
jgi:hypothetical protein